MASIAPAAFPGLLLPGLGHRALALALDTVPVLLAGYVLARWTSPALAGAAVAALWLTNRAIAVGLTGRSLGKALTGLTVVPIHDIDARVGVPRALAREGLTTAYLVSGALAVGAFFSLNPFREPLVGLFTVALASLLLLPLASTTAQRPLRQCPISDGLCRTAVLAD